MLLRLRLRTKLIALVAAGIIAVVVSGAPMIGDRLDEWRATEPVLDRVRAMNALSEVQRRIEREATLSAWFGASGEPSARSALAAARPFTDRSVRNFVQLRSQFARVDPSEALAFDAVIAGWTALRTGRVQIDRRLTSDTATLNRFDRVSASVGRAIDAVAAPRRGVPRGPGDPTPELRARALGAGLERALALEQAAVMTAVARRQTSRALADRVRALDTDITSRSGPAVAAASTFAGAAVEDAVRVVGARRATVAGLRAPTLMGAVPFLTPSGWLRVSTSQLDVLHTIGRAVEGAGTRMAMQGRSDARDALVRRILIVAASALSLLIVGAILIRAIRRPLRTVAAAAAAVASRPHGDAETRRSEFDRRTVPAPVAVRTHDEVGDIARAVVDIDRATIELTNAQRRCQRDDIGDLYVNLAQRNQPLLGRQIDLIDRLERADTDPDRLGMLFQLDHLAQRMRRNAESFLVLAGMENPRTHTAPVPVLEVLREAVSEIEQFTRVDCFGIPPDVGVLGPIAVDLGHLLAELIENATASSPPDSRVRIDARRRPAGLELSITDAGPGLSVDRLDALNEILAHPPLPGFDITQSLGLVVVARLGERTGVSVALRDGMRDGPDTGTTAVVHIPAALLAPVEAEPSLPRRIPPASDREPVAPVAVPERRTPDAVFELVARFEAGRRRAAGTTPSDRGTAQSER